MIEPAPATDRLVLHGSFTSSSSYKPMLFLVLSGLPFSFRTVNLKKGVQKEAPHLAINRYGQVPVLQHRGLTLVMSNVVLDYLARTTGRFEADSEQDRIHAREWLSWENDAITNVARVRHFACFRPDVPQQIVDYFALRRGGARLRRQGAGGPALAGRRPLHHRRSRPLGRMVFAAEGGMNLDRRPNGAWRERIMAMPFRPCPTTRSPEGHRVRQSGFRLEEPRAASSSGNARTVMLARAHSVRPTTADGMFAKRVSSQ